MRPINIRECIRYITKQDQNSILINFPLKFTSTIYRAKLYADQGNRQVIWSDYIPSLIAASERKVFENFVLIENKKKEIELLKQRSNHLILFPWQVEVLRTISEEDNDRSVFWVEDEVGGAGKSVLTRYIVGCEEWCSFSGLRLQKLQLPI